MNEQNFLYLKDNLKYLGFGEHLNETLANNLKQGAAEFFMTYKTEINKKPFEATLYFRRSDASDLYFLNSYTASLQRNNGEKLEQSFYLNNGKGVTAKEAYNLLEGRPVFKELSNKNGEKYHAWLQINFQIRDKRDNYEVKQYHQKYGYDLRAAVSRFAVSELKDTEKEKALLHSLEKGNIQSVTIEKDGFTHKMILEANPQYKTVNLYDADMKRVQRENIGMYQSETPSSEMSKKQNQVQKQERSEKNKQDISGGVKSSGEKKGRSKKNSIGM
jgi:hypothetical protein